MTADQQDFCSGLSLLYWGPKGAADQYVDRMHSALLTGDVEEAEHVSALMLCMLNARGTDIRELSNRWMKEFALAANESARKVGPDDERT